MSVTDPDWKERIVAAAEGRATKVNAPNVEPYYMKIHANQPGDKPFAIEVRPRAGVWAPFLAGILFDEKERVDPFIMIGPRDVPTNSGMLVNSGHEKSSDGRLWIMVAGNQATPNDSYFIWCKELPTWLMFGVNGRQPQFQVQMK